MQIVKLSCVHLRLCHIAIAISRAHSLWQFSLTVFVIKYVNKSKIVLITGKFSTSAKFHNIPQKYQNSAAKGKFCGSARNSTDRGKPWAFTICITQKKLARCTS